MKKEIKYQGEIQLLDKKIPCFITKDGKRYFTEEGMKEALNVMLGVKVINCELCEAEIPKIAEILKELIVKNLNLYWELLGQNFICDTCEEKYCVNLEKEKNKLK